ncbi:methylated-DNA--[protein]-cysteine S-methyltransferase [Pseudorhodoferax sp.]|uniref:methylated-DNA--[protein]-cysteine S-methyltransferase n=1 Tax=Pseudorhodoferax sp. TaxID=1993553 RepID=UPI002DD6285D|nr:methylated-DNA--[protein]-cysteine S-methyltransferase [Pseudorhodoferax sp.]
MKITLSELPSPLGPMLLASDAQGRVRGLEFAERSSRLHRNLRAHCGGHEAVAGPAPKDTSCALERYFSGDLCALDGIGVATAGSGLQEQVWAELRRLPAGTTTSYGALGRRLGLQDWRAAVEVGAMVGANPVAIVVPCHRVVGAQGDLKGYAWGLHRKRWLLVHERAIQPQTDMPATAALF